VEILLIKAAEDEAALKAVGNPDAILGFHAQQAVEKLMKSLISARLAQFELTHDLTRLVKALQGLAESLPTTALPLSDLNDFAVDYRYDLLFQHAIPSRDDLIETVRLIREPVVTRVSTLSATP
jgi:HEPN domain-containing protein